MTKMPCVAYLTYLLQYKIVPGTCILLLLHTDNIILYHDITLANYIHNKQTSMGIKGHTERKLTFYIFSPGISDIFSQKIMLHYVCTICLSPFCISFAYVGVHDF